MPNIIKNFDELATTEKRRQTLEIAEAGLEAINTKKVIKSAVRFEGDHLCVGDKICSLSTVERIFVTGIGKCAFETAEALEEVLGEHLAGGLVIGVEQRELPKLGKIKVFAGTHPMPTDENVKAAKALVEELQALTEKDLVLVVVSGGGSTLLCLPQSNSCVEEDMVLRSLFRAGATIQEINTVRKHMSLARGGFLAKYAYPAQVISLIFSDVTGDDLQFIASGPTIKDSSTVADAHSILEKHKVKISLGDQESSFDLLETPKEDKYFENVQNVLLVTNDIALEAMAAKAKELGLKPEICETCLEGEAREVGWKIVAGIQVSPEKSVHLYGGETTVTAHGHGKGGRNQELCLSTLMKLESEELVLSLASDGIDNTEAAGAIADKQALDKTKELGLDPLSFLNENDSFTLFEKIGSQIITGRTGANVSDLVVAIK